MKKHILRIAMLAFALLALTAVLAFTAAATDVTGGYIYELSITSAKNTSDGTKNVWQWNYHAFTVGETYTEADLETLYAHDSETGARIDTGLRYDFDSATGTLTIYPADGVDPADIATNVVWGFPNEYMNWLQAKGGEENEHIKYFKRSTVKNIIIDAEGLKALPEQSINQFAALVNITIPKSMTTFWNYSLSRCSVLKSVTVLGNEPIDYTVDLRNLTFTASSTFSETFASKQLPATITFLLGEGMCKQPAGRNIAFGVPGDATSAEGGQSKGTGTIHVYTPTGETCEWVDDISRRTTTQWSLYPSYYDVYVFPYPNAVTELGYQVRTKGYNGLRALFELDIEGATSGIKVIDHGTLLDTPEVVSGGSSTLVEYGTIAATEAVINTYGYELTKIGGEYVTANPAVKKVAVTSANMNGNRFCVSVVNFSSKSQMGTSVFMCGYEVWRDESGSETVRYTVDGGRHCEPVSLYDATVGVFKAGLANSSVDVDGLLWDILDEFKYNVQLTEATKNIKTESGADVVYPYSVIAGGELVHSSYSNVKILIFELSDGTYTAIARGSGTYGGGVRSVNYVRENFLSEAYIGVPIDTLVIDDGFTSINESGTSGFSVYTRVNEDPNKCANFTSSLKTIIIPQSVTSLSSQVFHSDSVLSTVVRFDPERAQKNPNYVADSEGIADMSTFTNVAAADRFNGCKAIRTLILPEATGATTIPARFIYNCASLTRVYCVGHEIPAEGTADFRGTGYVFSATLEPTNSGKVFQSTTLITTVIDDVDTYTRTGSLTWESATAEENT